jgi:hypothetical protein
LDWTTSTVLFTGIVTRFAHCCARGLTCLLPWLVVRAMRKPRAAKRFSDVALSSGSPTCSGSQDASVLRGQKVVDGLQSSRDARAVPRRGQPA